MTTNPIFLGGNRFVSLPNQFAVDGVTVQPARTEVGVDPLGISTSRRRGKSVRRMRGVMRCGRGRDPLPQHIPRAAIKTQ